MAMPELPVGKVLEIAGRRAENASELQTQVRESIKASEPVLIEVPVGPMPNMFKALGLP
jgi:thiamine pyrophosphate-dependent acetolactate synthase large subunit-like protein